MVLPTMLQYDRYHMYTYDHCDVVSRWQDLSLHRIFFTIYYTSHQKTFFFKELNFLKILEQICVLNTTLPSLFPQTTQFSHDHMLKFRKLQIFVVLPLLFTLADKKKLFFFKMNSKLSYILVRSCVLNTILPLVFPETTQFPCNYMLKFQKN